MTDAAELTERIKAHVEAHSLLIHPDRDLKRFVEFILKKGGRCPCDPKRPSCPCPESVTEVATLGRCTCTFLVSGDYLDKRKTSQARQ